MRKYILLFLTCFTLLTISSCKKDDLIITKDFPLDLFTEIELESAFEVFLIQDSFNYIQIESHESKMDDIDFMVQNQSLNIINNNGYNWLTPTKNKIKLYIHYIEIKNISANESCIIKSKTPIRTNEFGIILKSRSNIAELELDCHTFYYWNNFPCGGKLTLTGNAKYVKIWNTALMSVDAKNLIARRVWVENLSKGICEVNATDTLEYLINGLGGIHLYGNPNKLIKLDGSSEEGLIKF